MFSFLSPFLRDVLGQKMFAEASLQWAFHFYSIQRDGSKIPGGQKEFLGGQKFLNMLFWGLKYF